ncbi:MAG TPA: 7TM diverse intracellular signaling domain-containing protein, partial [Chitinophagaceae bacterium]|nr:7TM diverse intracellular signaling domain-containing protein [Chitinophagaceae bacterium]
MRRNLILQYIFLTANFLLRLCDVSAQDSTRLYADLHSKGLVKYLTAYSSSAYIGHNENLSSRFGTISFSPGLINKGSVPAAFVSQKAILKFGLANSGDSTLSAYFFPGFFFQDIILYREKPDGLERLPALMPPIEDSIGFRLITLPPHDSAVFVAELHFVKTYINKIRPRLVDAGYVNGFIAELRSSLDDHHLVTYVFCGLLLMMVLYSLANFILDGKPEFLNYSGYAFFLGLMLLSKALFSFKTSPISYFIEGYFDFILQGLGIIFYMRFMRGFLNTKSQYPFLYRLYNAGITLLMISLSGFTVLHYFTNNYAAENVVENATKVLLLLMVVIFLVYASRHRNDPSLRYLFWGNLCLLVFSLFSQVIVMTGFHFSSLSSIFSSALFYYEIGLILELCFFLAAVNQKNRKELVEQTRERESLKAENLRKEYEKELAVYKAQQEERERISADMHDELGSGMTAIRLMSEIARNKMKENTPVEIEKISHSANDVLNKMNAIIWSMNSGNDTLDNLVSYIRSYALEYFENTPIECKVNTPGMVPMTEISGDKRRNIFLCVKETLTNTLKHSKASRLTIDI